MNIKIIKVELNTQVQKKDGGTYPGHRVTYEDQGQIKSKGFHEKALGYRPELKEQIEALEDGKWYNVQMEKNDQGYWEWISISEGSQDSKPNKSSGNSNNYQGNNTGIAVGHALHCASRLLAGNDFDAETLKKTAYMVYNVSKEMQGEIDTPEF